MKDEGGRMKDEGGSMCKGAFKGRVGKKVEG